jgi:hypothetical protein
MEDMMDLWEIVAVSRFNEWMAHKEAMKKANK